MSRSSLLGAFPISQIWAPSDKLKEEMKKIWKNSIDGYKTVGLQFEGSYCMIVINLVSFSSQNPKNVQMSEPFKFSNARFLYPH